MASLLESLASQIGQQDVSQISRQLGTDENSTESAIEAALPLLVDALGRNADSDQGAEALTNALRNKHQGSVVDNLSSYLATAATFRTATAFWATCWATSAAWSSAAWGSLRGWTRTIRRGCWRCLAPVVLGQLGQMQQRNNMGANDVQNLLSRRAPAGRIAAWRHVPPLDMDGDGDITDDMMNIGGRLLGGFFARSAVGGCLGDRFGTGLAIASPILFFLSPLVPCLSLRRFTSVAVVTAHFAFLNFLCNGFPGVSSSCDHHRDGVAFLSSHVVKLKNYRVGFATINAMMRFQIVEQLQLIFLNDCQITTSNILDVPTLIIHVPFLLRNSLTGPALTLITIGHDDYFCQTGMDRFHHMNIEAWLCSNLGNWIRARS